MMLIFILFPNKVMTASHKWSLLCSLGTHGYYFWGERQYAPHTVLSTLRSGVTVILHHQPLILSITRFLVGRSFERVGSAGAGTDVVNPSAFICSSNKANNRITPTVATTAVPFTLGVIYGSVMC